MWFSLFAVVLILTITFFQGLQGLFSAVISCFLTIMAVALAFGLYEDIYYAFLLERQPDHGRAFALMAVFILSLLILRTVFDMLITGNMRFPILVDRIGGGVVGLFTAMLIVGTLAVGLQMLPFGTTFLGFSRYQPVDKSTGQILASTSDKPEEVRSYPTKINWSTTELRPRSMWLSPDGLTVSVASHLSGNALHGRTSMATIYPNLLHSLYAARSGYFRETRHAVPAGVVRVERYDNLPPRSLYLRESPKEGSRSNETPITLKLSTEQPAPGHKWVVVRVTIDSAARDEDNVHRFTTEQVRLVGGDKADGPAKEYFLVGVNLPHLPRWVRLYRGEQVTRDSDQLKVDWIFEVPDNPGFQPRFVEFKQNARAEIPVQVVDPKKPKAALTPLSPAVKKTGPEGDDHKEGVAPEGGADTGSGGGSNTAPPPPPGGDRISGLGAARKESTFSDQLPFALVNYNGQDLQLSNGTLNGGRVRATLNPDWTPKAGSEPSIERFQVPEGKVMLQLSVEKLQPQSWLGSIYGGMIDNIGDFYMIDAKGTNYRPAGSYAMAVVGGQARFELIYLDDVARDMARLPKFETIKASHMVGNYSVYYLFHVPPGTQPAKLHTGRTNVDLSALNLVAPG
ncbi:MAG: CvpA family protein [Phycisphaerae bacterium]|nr:CvpA family protein [Phycisphaerae bacterium]